MNKINNKVLMSGVDFFAVEQLNPYSSVDIQPNLNSAQQEYNLLQKTFEEAGIEVVKVAAPENCQDGVYTANWALCLNGLAIMANLPKMRSQETPFATKYLRDLGYDIVNLPEAIRFSGQGDALVCGDYIFAGYGYRTDLKAHKYIKQAFSGEVVSLQTVPAFDASGQPIINTITGWPDSYFYDIDLAVSVINEDLIAWCPEAFLPESQEKMKSINIEKIEVSLQEALGGFACNLLSTGDAVIMSDNAPKLQAELEKRGLKTITPTMTELSKGGGYIRCTTLTLG
jgi:N-dimethylarginine dimethylaminohydrolase